MNNVIDFCNFRIKGDDITADMIVNGRYIMQLSDSLLHLENFTTNEVRIYDEFRQAVLAYLESIGFVIDDEDNN